MTDPWTLHASLSCPSCHVKGKVVSDLGDRYEYEDPRMVCCECGQSWDDAGVYADCALKEARIHFARLIEGRPYEPPAPVKREPGKGIGMDEFDSVLRDYYQPDSLMWSRGASPWFAAFSQTTSSASVTMKLHAQSMYGDGTWHEVTMGPDLPEGAQPSVIVAELGEPFTFKWPMPDLPEPEDE